MRPRRTPLIAIATAVLSAGALTGALLTTGTVATAEPATTSHAATTAQAAGVPWSHVGPGWVLAQYTTAAPEGGKAGPVTLYLISPGGARYQLARWPDSRTAPGLVAWSPDGKRALFQVFSGQERAEQLTLATGRKSTFLMQGNATPIGYTTPRGLNIVGTRPSGTRTILAGTACRAGWYSRSATPPARCTARPAPSSSPAPATASSWSATAAR